MAAAVPGTAPLRPPPRPDRGGKQGRKIQLVANHYKVKVPVTGSICHYDVAITPPATRNLSRAIFEVVLDKYKKLFVGQMPAYDGMKNLYSKGELPFPSSNPHQVEVEVDLGDSGPSEKPSSGGPPPPRGKGKGRGAGPGAGPGPGEKPAQRGRTFKVVIKLVNKVDLASLDSSTKDYGVRVPHETLQALDVVMRQLATRRYKPVGQSLYYPPTKDDEYTDLGGGREVWPGYYASIRPTQWKLTLNVDTTATTFFKAQPVLSLMDELLRAKVRDSRELRDWQLKELQTGMKSIRVQTTHGKGKRKFTVCGIKRENAQTKTIEIDLPGGGKKKVTVAQYFKDTYDITLSFPRLNLLQVGQRERDTCMPMELCDVVEGQRCIRRLTDDQRSAIIKATAKPAPERRRKIEALVQKNDLNNDPYLKSFGIVVDPKMAQLEGRVINPPELRFAGQKGVMPRQGKWDMRSNKYFDGKTISKWCVLSFTGDRDEPKLIAFSQRLMEIAKQSGLFIQAMPTLVKYLRRPEELERTFNEIKNNRKDIQMVLVVLQRKDTATYSEVKRCGDQAYGIVTQCVLFKNVMKCQDQTLSNICLKINSKLGGVNSIIKPELRGPLFNAPIIIFGADVTHPAPGPENSNKPSIAAVVASMDKFPNRYDAIALAQTHRKEVIEDLQSTVKKLLISFYKSNNAKPCRIIFYRDGVGEGQFSEILAHELAAIQAACTSLEKDYKPAITFIVVQKRHHTRLFCANDRDADGRAQNVPPGTTVDTGIVHPTEFDFFLCSHAGIQGTSRPCHYHVLWDDNKFTSDSLQTLTYQLCHTYVKCTRTVSLPAPAYYAHHVAFRARYHMNMDGDSDGGSVSSGGGGVRRFELGEIKLHEDIMKTMYYA